MRSRSIGLPLLALAVLAGVYLVRARAPEGEPEADVVLPAEPTPEPSGSPPREGRPETAQVQRILDRVFAETLVVDLSWQPPAVTGDFNGDGQPDLAATARPRDLAALSRLNADLSPWRAQDAASLENGERVRLTAGESVLAVVHGAPGGGWRGPDAGQGYVVRHAAGSGMRPQPLADVPDGSRMRVNRAHAGDVIAAERNGEPGLVLWTGAAYAWVGSRPPTARAAPALP